MSVKTNNFVNKLYAMVNEGDPAVISWVPSGDAFLISSVPALESSLLPHFFRHSRFASLIRQLNFYEFRKINRERSFWIYSHPLFHRDKPADLKRLRRRTCPGVDGRTLARKRRRLPSGAFAPGRDLEDEQDDGDDVVALNESDDKVAIGASTASVVSESSPPQPQCIDPDLGVTLDLDPDPPIRRSALLPSLLRVLPPSAAALAVYCLSAPVGVPFDPARLEAGGELEQAGRAYAAYRAALRPAEPAGRRYQEFPAFAANELERCIALIDGPPGICLDGWLKGMVRAAARTWWEAAKS
ncbi:hypothetical protein TeGR_g8507 [Tetraparma gracilis]|uniref:HSF-type DNA-binding domain-containing protein n=1 Tax=Tetraparma gracilis TaxID=2962635 RepID=A0ABQ6MT64_9STRA|nr:hypothetical protein TeGR_g8507 [Tetraparma gracilis]